MKKQEKISKRKEIQYKLKKGIEVAEKEQIVKARIRNAIAVRKARLEFYLK